MQLSCSWRDDDCAVQSLHSAIVARINGRRGGVGFVPHSKDRQNHVFKLQNKTRITNLTQIHNVVINKFYSAIVFQLAIHLIVG
jgi:hypothetical protein